MSSESKEFPSLSLDSPLAQLLLTHDPSNTGFITLVDRSTLVRKRVAFLKALVLNLGLLALMTWLIFLMRNMFTDLHLTPMSMFYLGQDIIILWAIFSLFINTTIPFFFGECILRLRCGFRPTEVVFLSLPTPDSSLSEVMNLEHLQRLVACSDPYLAYTNFQSSLTGGTSCTIVYSAIQDAYKMIDSGEIDTEELDSVVWVRGTGVWGVCQFCKTEGSEKV